MGLVSTYSKRPELLVDLDHVSRQLGHAADDNSSRSVQSTGRVGRAHGLQDRLTDEDVRKIVLSYEAGELRQDVAARYSISVSSVARLLRRYRQSAAKAG